MIFVRLKERITKQVCCVSTYHMPCLFWSPPVMLLHAAAVKHLTSTDEDPFVLCGDFNLKPSDPGYSFLTLSAFHPKVQKVVCSIPKVKLEWWSEILKKGHIPLRSAYASVVHMAPDRPPKTSRYGVECVFACLS